MKEEKKYTARQIINAGGIVMCVAGFIFGIYNSYQGINKTINFRNNFNTISNIVYGIKLQNQDLKKDYNNLLVYEDKNIKKRLDEIINSSENFMGAIRSNPQFIKDKEENQKTSKKHLDRAGIGIGSFIGGLFVVGAS